MILSPPRRHFAAAIFFIDADSFTPLLMLLFALFRRHLLLLIFR